MTQRVAGILVSKLLIYVAPFPNNTIAATIFIRMLKIYDFITFPSPTNSDLSSYIHNKYSTIVYPNQSAEEENFSASLAARCASLTRRIRGPSSEKSSGRDRMAVVE